MEVKNSSEDICNFKTEKTHKKIQTDVLVVGGGTAGFVAAIAAARNGARVILVEQRDHLGGTHSGGMVFMIRSMRHMRFPRDKATKTGFESSFEDQQVVFSIAQEYLDRMIECNSAWGFKGQAAARQLFDPEIAKWVIEQMVVESGVDVWFYSQATDVLLSGNSVQGLVIENLQEKIEIKAKVTIDATGDGDVCVAAGASFQKGSPEDGCCQPLTLYFGVGGVNFEKTLSYMVDNTDEFGKGYVDALLRLKKEGKPITISAFKSKIKEALANGDYPIPYGLDKIDPEKTNYWVRPLYRNGKIRYAETYFNMNMAFNVDATDRKELTRATIAMRDIAVKMANFYRKYVPGYEDSYLIQTAQVVGIRDTRRIVCDYTLTENEVLSGETFKDAIARYGSVVDVHDKGGADTYFAEIGGAGWFHIPYRILLPQGIENLLVAGRCVSADYVAQGCTRSQAACMVTGQAAGTAAALSAKEGIEPRNINIPELQRVLASQNQSI